MRSLRFVRGAKLPLKRVAIGGALSLVAWIASLEPASAQMIPGIDGPLESLIFSQDLTDAVTQGFRQRDRVFFEEGVVQFEALIDSLQDDEQHEPILVIEPVLDNWQQFETVPEQE